MFVRFNVDCHDISAFGDEILDKLAWVFYHEMDVKRFRSNILDGLHNEGAYGDVGYKMAIHDVDMDKVCSCLFNVLYLLP